jgi:hypothetical protein
LDNPRYRDKARWFQKVITQTRGLDVAAKVIERAFNRYYKVSVNYSLQFADVDSIPTECRKHSGRDPRSRPLRKSSPPFYDKE